MTVLAGSSAGVAEAGDRAAAAGGRFQLAGSSLAANGRAVTARWRGRSAESARAGLLRLSARSQVGSDIAGRAAAVLRRYSVALQTAEVQAQRTSADLDRLRHRDPLPAQQAFSASGLATALPGDLERGLAALRSQAQQANEDAARQIDQLVADLAAMGEASAAQCGTVAFEPTVDTPTRSSRLGHGVLQTLGLIPVFGEPADLVDALGYTLEGDRAGAAISAAAAVPILGSGARAVSLVKTTDRAADAAEAAASARAVRAAYRRQNGISPQKQDMHMIGTPSYKNRMKDPRKAIRTSTWSSNDEADALTVEAWAKGVPDAKRSHVREYEFGREVGRGPGGGAQTRVRVHQAPSNGLMHGHPAGPES